MVSGSDFRSALRDGWSGELAIQHRDGRLLKLPAEVRALFRQGNNDWLLTLASDWNNRQTPAAELPVLEWMFTDSPVAITTYDSDLRCVRQNPAMNRIVGMSSDVRPWRQFGDVLTSPDTDEWERLLREVLESGTPTATLTIRGRTPTDPDHGHVFTATASPLHDPTGNVVGVCATVRDITDEHGRQERLAILNDASTRIGSTLDVQRTAQELADVVIPRLADFISVDLLEPLLRGEEPGPVTRRAELRRITHLSVRAGTPEAAVEVGEVDYLPWHSPPARCLATGRPLLLRSTDSHTSHWFTEDPHRAEKAARYGFHSLMFIPIQARGVPLGVALFCRSWPTEPFEQTDVDLAEELITRAAISLDNARRFTRERTAALALQRSLLPGRLPQRPTLEVASRYLPAMSHYGVGGDWFDVIPLSGARVALVVGDVVGHGIHASATMGRLRTAIRSLADVDLPPDELLTHLDDLVTQLGDEEPFGPRQSGASDMCATALYAIYDPVSGKASLASAGHPPPAVMLPGGRAEFLDVSPGPPLGLGCLPFEVRDIQLPEGSEIALYTDGLISHRNLDADERLEHLRSSLCKSAASLQDRCDNVLGDLLPDHPPDDVALLIARTHTLGDDRVAVLNVPADPAFVAQARSWATDWLGTWGLETLGFVTELVVSELVTNAIRYGASPIQLRLIKDTTLICEVSDASSTAPHLRRARLFDEGGRGLLLIAQVTQRWGTRHTRNGKIIWCEQSLAAEDEFDLVTAMSAK
ncbi:SpoIIE family protein phosphatase [Streptomyces sp. NA02950]|uniref:SpoIIE family protein phosphatase n=1 Tax=Streptomyces sp. NA02950 TaxID=2742137 RepID=UPI0020CAFF5B|nr:SpoIIE family protein phosphatase [Streptomyces sp. NA02950]